MEDTTRLDSSSRKDFCVQKTSLPNATLDSAVTAKSKQSNKEHDVGHISRWSILGAGLEGNAPHRGARLVVAGAFEPSEETNFSRRSYSSMRINTVVNVVKYVQVFSNSNDQLTPQDSCSQLLARVHNVSAGNLPLLHHVVDAL